MFQVINYEWFIKFKFINRRALSLAAYDNSNIRRLIKFDVESLFWGQNNVQ